MLRLVVPLSILLAGPAAIPAAAPPVAALSEAEKTAAASQDAVRRLDWKAYAKLLHPEGLRDFRAILVPALESARKQGRQPEELLRCFEGGRDVQTILAWSPEEYFARFVKGTIGKGPMKELFASTTSKVIGTVSEGPARAHVLVRVTTRFHNTQMSRIEVLTLRRHAGAWKVEPGDPFRVLAEGAKHVGAIQEQGVSGDEALPEK